MDQMFTPPSTPAAAPAAPAPSLSVPVGAKIIAVLHYIAAIFLVFAGIMLAFVESFAFPALGTALAGAGLAYGLLILGWGVFSFATGSGLWRGKNWGRIIAITISSLYIVGVLIDFILLHKGNYIALTVNLVITLYLLLSNRIKQVFAAQPASMATTVILVAVAIAVYAGWNYPSWTTDLWIKKTSENIAKDIAAKNSNTGTSTSASKNQVDGYTNYEFNLPLGYTIKTTNEIGDHGAKIYDQNNKLILVLNIEYTTKTLSEESDYQFKYESHPVEKTNTTISSEPAIRAIETWPNGKTLVWYIVVHENYLYDFSMGADVSGDQLQYVDTNQFNSLVKAFKFKQ